MPDGIGLFFFLGCKESFLESIKSFKMYVPLELIQRIPNPTKLKKIEFVSLMFNDPTIGININKFLYHCFGLKISKAGRFILSFPY